MIDGATYLTSRCGPQIAYFEAKANTAKRWHQRSIIALAVVAASIPVVEVAGIPSGPQRLAGAILGAMVVVIQAVRSTKRWHEDWLLFRTAEESLKTEKWFYQTRSGDYVNDDRDNIFVSRVENLLGTFNGTFIEAHRGTEAKRGHEPRGHGA